MGAGGTFTSSIPRMGGPVAYCCDRYTALGEKDEESRSASKRDRELPESVRVMLLEAVLRALGSTGSDPDDDAFGSGDLVPSAPCI